MELGEVLSGAGDERSRVSAAAIFVSLEPFLYQNMRWCVNCGGQQIFIEVFEFNGGRCGYCLGCGAQRVAYFKREVSEAA